ncbi:flagellar biosynthetic protein FliO [Colwellia sp. 39_35_sub15_T18]|nr:flagellar biosynthetic protein FliO [Colwellia sp. 39_35_sub15_T18]
MAMFLRLLTAIFFSFCVQVTYAQQAANQDIEQSTEPTVTASEQAPEVGKHVMANMDAGSMVLSLLMVLALIIISALVLKRFNLAQQNTKQLSVVASLSLGAKERLVIVQVAEQQLVLGVTAQQITLIDNLAEPIVATTETSLPMAGNVLAFLQKASGKQSK